MKKILLVTSMVALVAACQQYDGNREGMDNPKIIEAEKYASDNNIGPGDKVLTVDALVQQFNKFCVEEKSLGANGFEENKVTGTWYNREYNLAVNNTSPQVCQMAFGSGQNLDTVQAAFTAAQIPGLVGVEQGELAYKGAAMYLATREK